MTLSDRQDHFNTDMALFILWCKGQGLKVTLGEGYRTQYQQDEYLRTGLSHAAHSKHQDRLAQDLNFFFDGESMWSITEKELVILMQPIGDHWESMREGNRWGGNFKNFFDVGHFEAE